MTIQYSGRTSAFQHKRDDWKDQDITGVADAIQTEQIFYVQWTNCPIEVYNEVVELWKKDLDLRNGSFFSWDRDGEYWDENTEDESEKTLAQAYPLIDEYLMGRGISKILINYWW